MHWLAILPALALIVWVLVDSFETIVVPRRVMHRFRFARLYYRIFWTTWGAAARRLPDRRRREAMLSWFGPLSVLGLIATWAVGLIVGFAVLNWSFAVHVKAPEGEPDILTYLYMGGVTFFTLGYGDVTPQTTGGRVLAVTEAGIGFGFLAAIISYLPVLFQAFSRREATIALLDARAGSPPSASQFLLRLAKAGNLTAADPFLAEWERWAAELLESHLSFPSLSFYRSQHDNQSWLAALTAILDSCSFLIIGTQGTESYQAQLTFAMARHAAVDLALILNVPPEAPSVERLPTADLLRLQQQLGEAGVQLCDPLEIEVRLAELRAMYEPFVAGLARRLMFTLPPIVIEETVIDNWQRSARMPRPPGIGNLPGADDSQSHFG